MTCVLYKGPCERLQHQFSASAAGAKAAELGVTKRAGNHSPDPAGIPDSRRFDELLTALLGLSDMWCCMTPIPLRRSPSIHIPPLRERLKSLPVPLVQSNCIEAPRPPHALQPQGHTLVRQPLQISPRSWQAWSCLGACEDVRPLTIISRPKPQMEPTVESTTPWSSWGRRDKSRGAGSPPSPALLHDSGPISKGSSWGQAVCEIRSTER